MAIEVETTRPSGPRRIEGLERSPAAPGASGLLRSLVLVVEDDVAMNKVLCHYLQPKYRTESAFDGEVGLAKALALQPDLILSDMRMPLKTGDQLVRAVRERRELDSTPIVLLSADDDRSLRAMVLREGAQDYVSKPFEPEELLARLANLLGAKRARDVLQAELDSQVPNLELLARELSLQKRQLAGALEAMRAARDLAERASELKDRFLSLVSHELRTPITALLLQIQLLLRHPHLPQQEGHQHLKTMNATTKRLASLIGGLLEYAGIAGGPLEIKLERIELRTLLAEVVESLRPQAQRKGLALRLGPPAVLPLFESDARLLRLVLDNLVSNAIKFTEHGAVDISVASAGSSLIVRITDTGPGILPEDRLRIFEPFEQLAALQEKHLPGLGLGLALVHQLVTALGGEVKVESEPGCGSTFELTLPCAVATPSAVH